jgi:glycosyltransferase involved in cell wall biosynthesis
VAEDEQVEPSARRQTAGDHILVLGNNYDHKDVRRTLKLLVDAFPFEKFVAIGIPEFAGPNVVAMESGYIDNEEIHQLMATARAVVIPSFYEGFGMPVVQALAYGRSVIVRQSELWEEIAGICRLPGLLVSFEGISSLVEAVGRALRGEPARSLPQGKQLQPGEAPLRWRDCSQRMVNSIEELMSVADSGRWLERDEALQSLQALRF